MLHVPLKQNGNDRVLKVGLDDNGCPVRMKLKHYLMHTSNPRPSRDDSPLYIFGSTFLGKRCVPPLQQVRATAHSTPFLFVR